MDPFTENLRKESYLPKLHSIYSVNNLNEIYSPLFTNEDLSIFKSLQRPSSNQVEILGKYASLISEGYERITKIFSEMLGGDSVTGEYLLLNLISRVHTRKDALTLGNLSVNLTNIPQPSQIPKKGSFSSLPLAISSLYESIIGRLLYLPLSLDILDKWEFVPKKNHETNELEHGLLQLTKHTSILIDETALSAGTLQKKGIANLEHLNHMITNMSTQYDFQFSQVEFLNDFKVLICSEGESLFKNNTILCPIDSQCALQIDLESISNVSQEDLILIRTYLQLVSHPALRFEIGEEISQIVQEDFIKARADKDSKITPDSMHLWLNLSRLLSLARGKLNLENEEYSAVKEMEQIRNLRIQEYQEQKNKK